jgi:hypothetical protein
VWKSGKVHTGVWWVLEGKYYLQDLSVDGRIILKLIFKKWNGAWTRLIWLRIGTGNGLF